MTNEHSNKIPPGTWEMFSIDTNEDEAAARFQAKHGHPPERVEDMIFGVWPNGQRKGYLIVGPVKNGRDGHEPPQ